MPSFDIVSEVNHVEIRNAVDQSNKEITNRFDFKGSDARVEVNEKEKTLTVYADDEFKLRQVRDVLTGKLAKRGVDIRALEPGKMEPVSGNKMKETIRVRDGWRPVSPSTIAAARSPTSPRPAMTTRFMTLERAASQRRRATPAARTASIHTSPAAQTVVSGANNEAPAGSRGSDAVPLGCSSCIARPCCCKPIP